jgi:hypothetical protein
MPVGGLINTGWKDLSPVKNEKISVFCMDLRPNRRFLKRVAH